jgi:aspartate kinase
MRVIVQKFGGTSVASPDLRAACARHVQAALAEDYRVVVVVSAMGRRGDPYATDTLLSTLEPDDTVSNRDRDILLSCGEAISAVVFGSYLRSLGMDVSVLSGQQAGIVTNDHFGEARILEIQPQRIQTELARGRVVIVMGFQGATERGDVTTLGRGGSDTTATALGVALGAEYADIFTDVDGIMTADPRIVHDAKRLLRITYQEICNLAYQGAKVIHPRAVEIAMQKNLPIRVRHTLSMDEGTLVTNELPTFEVTGVNDRFVTGIAHTAHVTQIVMTSENPDARTVFGLMAEHGISVDFISMSTDRIAYTVRDADTDKAGNLLEAAGFQPFIRRDCAKVSVVGAGIAGVPGIMARIVDALGQEEIDVLQSADSHTTIWCLVEGRKMERAVQALHRVFGLAD